jgi:Na+-translocating ferredoxin:NAD+ oxidoreductase RnfD subunit
MMEMALTIMALQLFRVATMSNMIMVFSFTLFAMELEKSVFGGLQRNTHLPLLSHGDWASLTALSTGAMTIKSMAILSVA